MKIPYIILIFLAASLALTGSSFAQEENYGEKKDRTRTQEENFEYNSVGDDSKKWDWTRARIGGNLGLAFRSGGVTIDASPTFGYRINNVLELGAGFKVFYFKDDNIPLVDGNGYVIGYVPYKDLLYGPIVYTRLFVWEGVFAQAQYEMVNKEPYYLDNPNDRINVHHLLLGGGYSSSLGNVGHIYISLLYNVLDTKESIYQFGTFGAFPLLLNVSFGFGIGGRK